MKSAMRPAGGSAEPSRKERRPNESARPTYLNPLKVRLPVTATVSLGHRISGLMMVLTLPLLLWGLSLSLSGEAGYRQMTTAFAGWPGRALLLGLTWALAHHMAAGVRHLLFDVGVGTHYAVARRTAWAVHLVALGVVCVVVAVAVGRLA